MCWLMIERFVKLGFKDSYVLALRSTAITKRVVLL